MLLVYFFASLMIILVVTVEGLGHFNLQIVDLKSSYLTWKSIE